ncbi:MAG: PqqD family protein [Marinicellaceae bacterium]
MTYKVNPKILQTPVSDGKLLILEPEKGLYFELNEVSVLIFQCIKDGIEINEISNRIIAEFDISLQTASSDLEMLLFELSNKNIIFKEL